LEALIQDAALAILSQQCVAALHNQDEFAFQGPAEFKVRRAKQDNAASPSDLRCNIANDVVCTNHLDRTVNRVIGTESVLLIRPF